MLRSWFIPRIRGTVTVVAPCAAVSVLGLLLIAGAACAELVSSDPLTASEVAAVKAELTGRSFRQFGPRVDGDPRKGVNLDFLGHLSLYAQYGEGGYAPNEWEIVTDDYRVERAGSEQTVTLYPVAPRTWQQYPTECRGCINLTGVSVSRSCPDGGWWNAPGLG